MHQIYFCTDSMNIVAEIFSKTEALINKAAEGCEDIPVLWLRGILPHRDAKVNGWAEFHDAKNWMSPNFDAVLAKSKLGFIGVF